MPPLRYVGVRGVAAAAPGSRACAAAPGSAGVARGDVRAGELACGHTAALSVVAALRFRYAELATPRLRCCVPAPATALVPVASCARDAELATPWSCCSVPCELWPPAVGDAGVRYEPS